MKKINSIPAKASAVCDPTPQLQPDLCSAKQFYLPYEVAPGEEAGWQLGRRSVAFEILWAAERIGRHMP